MKSETVAYILELPIYDPPFQKMRPRFPIFKVDISRRLPPSQRVQRDSWRHHDGGHEAVSDGS